jgi:hypothetical protein
LGIFFLDIYDRPELAFQSTTDGIFVDKMDFRVWVSWQLVTYDKVKGWVSFNRQTTKGELK